MGEGFRGRSRDVEGRGAGRAAAGSAARRWWTCIPGWTGRTRWWRRSTTACMARAGRRRASTRPCTGWSMRRTWIIFIPDSGIAIATAADGEQLTKAIFGEKVTWVPWRRPGFQLGLDIAEIKEANPAVGRLHPRRPRDHGLGRHQRGGRDQLAVDHRHRRRLHRRAQQGGAVRAGAGRLRRAAGDGAARQGGGAGGDAAVDRLGGCADGRSLQRRRTGAGVPGLDRAPAPGGAGHLLPGSLPADQGEAAGAGPARRRERRGLDRPVEGAPRGVPGRLPGLLRPQRRPRTRRPSAGRIRRSSWSPGSGCSRTARTSRPPGWRASST